LNAPRVIITFSGCNKSGWYFVNGHLVGESHIWQNATQFEVKEYLHPGENIIAVGVKHDGRWGGLNPNVNLEILPKASRVKWSRSLFNGLAQILVQSTRTPGEIKLSAYADGLTPATATIETLSAPFQQSTP